MRTATIPEGTALLVVRGWVAMVGLTQPERSGGWGIALPACGRPALSVAPGSVLDAGSPTPSRRTRTDVDAALSWWPPRGSAQSQGTGGQRAVFGCDAGTDLPTRV